MSYVNHMFFKNFYEKLKKICNNTRNTNFLQMTDMIINYW